MVSSCPICNNIAKYTPVDFDGKSINCMRCGEYSISGTLFSMLQQNKLSDTQIVLLSAYVRNNQKSILGKTEFDRIITNNLPSVDEKVEIFMLLLEKLDNKPSALIDITKERENYYKLISHAYIRNESEWKYLLRYLQKELEYLDFHGDRNGYSNSKQLGVVITPTGWKFIQSIKTKNKNSSTAFIAMWFNPKVEKARDVIKQAIRDAGYEPKIVNAEPFNGDIVDQIITLINRAKFVVSDLTEQRQGVYFEAGYAKGLNIPVIYTVNENEIDPKPTKDNPYPLKVHFDLNHQNIITWKEDNLKEFQQKLKDRITATIGDGPFYKEKKK